MPPPQLGAWPDSHFAGIRDSRGTPMLWHESSLAPAHQLLRVHPINVFVPRSDNHELSRNAHKQSPTANPLLIRFHEHGTIPRQHANYRDPLRTTPTTEVDLLQSNRVQLSQSIG